MPNGVINWRPLVPLAHAVSPLISGDEVSAGEAPETLFKFELNYAGLFRIANIPQNDMHPVVMIECPRLLFPFARQLIADAVRNGGFPPLYIDPIDFASLYRRRMEEMAAKPNAPASQT